MADSNWTGAQTDLLNRYFEAKDRERLAASDKQEADRRIKEARRDMTDVKGELASMMREAGVLTDKHELATLTIRDGKPGLVAADDADPDLLPVDMVRIKKEPDKGAITAALTAGIDVPGYSIKQGASSLSITPRKAG